jgi:hypothetical protein
MYPVLKHWEEDTTELEIKIITNYIWTSSYPKSNLVSDVKKKDKITNNNLQTITKKTKDRATRTPLKGIIRSCNSKKDKQNNLQKNTQKTNKEESH